MQNMDYIIITEYRDIFSFAYIYLYELYMQFIYNTPYSFSKTATEFLTCDTVLSPKLATHNAWNVQQGSPIGAVNLTPGRI